MLGNSKDCPKCGALHKSKPFCTYADGFHCFSCGYTKRGDRSFSDSGHKPEIQLPELSGEVVQNFHEFSLMSKAWLMKFHINEKHVKNNSIIEVHEHNKVWLVMPNIDTDGNIIFYQRRLMGERGFVSSGPKKQVYKQNFDNVSIILVEDFISYCRVGELFNCVCLFGTSLSNDEASYITRYYDDIYVWLDNDHERENNPGQKAAKKICKSLEYTLRLNNVNRGFTVRNSRIANIVTKNDPKYYTDTEIKQIIAQGGQYDDTEH